MHPRKLSKALIMAFAVMSACAHAEEPAYAAKSLFFGEDGEVKAVATEKPAASEDLAKAPVKSEGKPVVIATSARKASEKPKAVAFKSAKDLPIGAAYFVRLKKRDGALEDTLATRTFSTGDKFQLGLKVNRPSFVYIFNEDPNGRITMLHPRAGRSAAVDAMGTVFLPSQGAFEFQGPPGLEKLLVLMSEDEVFQPDAALQKIEPDLVTRAPSPLPKMAPVGTSPATLKTAAAASSSDCGVVMADAGSYASKAIVYAQDSNTATGNCNAAAAPAFASKAIVFSDDPQPAAGQQVASYVVKPRVASKKEPLLLKIQLVHD
ncbi:DUF4384 domain-containing protein [Variovorax sp. dw_954]|uniref:DUF4384 domain-containing protein n=1 Tax=Variovorax sp. dw_954 TaxID=2720078 RepID=UPI001BD667F5|nr:DUF4384 domain-containing protein [Variovorax sp. dw_954]